MKPVRIDMILEKFASGFAGLEALIRRSAFKQSSKALYLELARDRINRLRITYRTA
jgi:hypothetical protein